MRYAINLPAFGPFADVRALAILASEAEAAGWDGFFIWDHIQAERGMPVADPWVALAVIAMQTRHIRIGALVTPLPRRRPWKLARETVTLDRLSEGRLVVGVGIGGDEIYQEFSTFGESTDDKLRGAQLDEGLAVLTGLWSGKPFSYKGQYYDVHDALFQPQPAQLPRIPIWVAGILPSKVPLRRAAFWDGVFPITIGHTIQPDEVREMLNYIRPYRNTDAPFDVVVAGYLGNRDRREAASLLAGYAEAGVTWWQEGFYANDSLDSVRKRIQQGPPEV